MHDLPPNDLPNYDQWFRKPCWRIKEICYLAQGLDPGCMPGGLILESDKESGVVKSRPTPVNYEAVVIATEFLDLIKRAIESGELKPPIPGSECFKPHDVVDYLNQESVSLPRGIVLPRELLVGPPESAKEAEVNAGVNAESGSEVCALFDPMKQKAIKALFNMIKTDEWKKYFNRAARNGLSDAREGNVFPHEYNPAKVSVWLVKKGIYTQEQIDRKLANNLPERSKDKRSFIIGEWD